MKYLHILSFFPSLVASEYQQNEFTSTQKYTQAQVSTLLTVSIRGDNFQMQVHVIENERGRNSPVRLVTSAYAEVMQEVGEAHLLEALTTA